MKLSTFQEKINNTERVLLSGFDYAFICLLIGEDALELMDAEGLLEDTLIGKECKDLFVTLYEPENQQRGANFYGSCKDPANQQIRVKKLREFEQYCIEHKSYLDW